MCHELDDDLMTDSELEEALEHFDEVFGEGSAEVLYDELDDYVTRNQ